MINVFLNITTQNDYQAIFDDIISYCDNDFYNAIDSFNIIVVGTGQLIIPDNSKFKILERIENTEVYGEFVTLNHISNFAKLNPNSYVLYLHSKGTFSQNNSCIVDWRRYMCYFNIKKFQLCLNQLLDNDTCGVDFVLKPVPHYSGNYWWSTTNWINQLDTVESQKIIISERHKCEFWICSKPGKHSCLWNSNIDVYARHLTNYKKNEYEN